MMKVVRALQLNDPAALFSRLMDQDALQVGVCVVRFEFE